MVPCPTCGAVNPGKARFCSNCGSPLQSVQEHREVRRTVTVLFCDVTGSTALGERLDAESLRQVMSRYFERMRRVLTRHGGTIEKFIGDAVMAVFGLPELHEDDTLRAVRAAAEMGDELERLNDELERDAGVRIQVRVGVNTGEVVADSAGAGATLVTGDAVNVAARLQQAGQPGWVLLGEVTQRLVRDAVRVEPLPPLAVKGKSAPVAAFRLLEVFPDVPGHVRRLSTPLVGREGELQLLAWSYRRAVRERTCHLVTVLGEAGVGKTRLVAELVDRSGGYGALTLAGGCLDVGDGVLPYAPVVEALRRSRRWIFSRTSWPGSVMGSGNGPTGLALAMPWCGRCWL
jgi:class 3 adenylate cyclase